MGPPRSATATSPARGQPLRAVARRLGAPAASYLATNVELERSSPRYQPPATHRGVPTVGETVPLLGAEAHSDDLYAQGPRALKADDVHTGHNRGLAQGRTTKVEQPSSTPDGEPATTWRPLPPATHDPHPG